jgi:O-antigen ligase
MEEIVTLEGVGSVCRVIGYATIALTILAVVATARIRPPAAIHWFMAMFFIWEAATLAWTANADSSLLRLFTMLRVMGMAWIIWEIAPEIRQQALVMYAYILGCSAAIFLQVMNVITGYAPVGFRFSGGGLDVNDFSLVQAMAIPMAIYLFRTRLIKMPWINWSCIVFCPASALSVLMTGSRTGFLVLLGMTVLFVMMNSKKLLRSIMIVVFSGGIAFLAFLYFAPSETVERILGSGEALGGSWTVRKAIVEEGLRVWGEHKYLGTGIGTFVNVTGGVEGEGSSWKYESSAHNLYLALLVETGGIGLGLFVAIMLVAAFYIWKMRPAERTIWVVIFIGWAVGVYAVNWDYHKATWFMFGMIACQYIVARRSINPVLRPASRIVRSR